MMKQSGSDNGHTLYFENEYIKVFETFLQPGQKLTMHSHKPHLRYCFTPGVNIHTWENGTVERITDKPGDYEWRDTLVHAVENGGDCVIHSLIFELKKDFVPLNKQEEEQSVKNITPFIPTSCLGKIYDLRELIADNYTVRIYEVNVKPSTGVFWRPNTLVFSQMEPDQAVTFEATMNNNDKVIIQNRQVRWLRSGYYKITTDSPVVVLFIELFQTNIRSLI